MDADGVLWKAQPYIFQKILATPLKWRQRVFFVVDSLASIVGESLFLLYVLPKTWWPKKQIKINQINNQEININFRGQNNKLNNL